ncbi:MAG: cytochrome c [Pedobacter sp.]|nr:MAG: cytochrome c [Pedobacter sp.]
MKLLPILFCGVTFASAFFSNQTPELTKSMARGKLLYEEACISCHMGKGEGLKWTFPPLAKADYLVKTPNKAIASIKYGLKGKIVVNGVTYDSMMPPPGLENDEVADIMNYILNSWGNVSKQPMITEKMVEAVK